jgi:type VI secretion system protein ImpK
MSQTQDTTNLEGTGSSVFSVAPDSENPDSADPVKQVDQKNSDEVAAFLKGEANQFYVEPEPDIQERLQRVLTAQNPLLEAARPLLRILSDMQDNLPDGPENQKTKLDSFRAALDREVRSFQLICDKASLRREHVLSARYCLCTAVDEAASSTGWGKDIWPNNSLASQFHQDTRGGEKFFLLLGRLHSSPREHIDLIELMYRILGLGFHGSYGTDPQGRRELESLRYNILNMINSVREPVEPALSPHWKGEGAGKLKLLRSVPVFVSVSILGLILFTVFAWKKYGLLSKANEVETQISQITKLKPLAELQTIRALHLPDVLSSGIHAGLVSVKEEGNTAYITLQGDALFSVGRAEVSAKMKPLIDRLTQSLVQGAPGTQGVGSKGFVSVTVIGYSDSKPINNPEFPNNQVLSEKRAASVAKLMVNKGLSKDRVNVIGKGDAEPLASNDTSQGRALNRRVEIVVKQ